MSQEIKNIPADWEKIENNKDLPIIYGNGIVLGISPTEFKLLFKTGKKDSALVYVPLSIAKSFHESLGAALALYESKTKKEIPTISELKISFTELKK